MTSQRDDASRNPVTEDRASAQSLRVEEAEAENDKSGNDGNPPRAGRTGKVGAKAERPADSRLHKANDGAPEPGRDRKVPSPAAKKGDAQGG